MPDDAVRPPYFCKGGGAVCTDSPRRDLVEVTRRAQDRVGQIQMARFNPAHEWVYFPDMEMDEAALIKTYDSATDGRNRFTIHTAFTDPTSKPDAAPRQSIETRCFAFF